MANDRDDQRKARELLAAEYDRDGIPFTADCIRTDATLNRDEERAIRAIVAALAQRHTEQCCTCGKRFDAREQSEGGGGEGAELTDGRWTCSADCWELATAQRAPQSGAVPEDAIRAAHEAGYRSGHDDGCNAPNAHGNWEKAWARDRDELLAAAPAPEATNCGPACARCGAPTGSACDERGCGYLDSGNGAPEAETLDESLKRTIREISDEITPEAGRAQGEAVAWAQDTPYGRAYSFADELGKAFPGLLSAPPPAGQPEGAEALAIALAEEVRSALDRQACPDHYMRIAFEAIESGVIRRLASAQIESVSGHDMNRLSAQWRNEAGDWDVGSTRAALNRCADQLEACVSAQQAEVRIDFPSIGHAGPFAVVNGEITLPAATMADLAHHFRMGYVEQQPGKNEENDHA